VYNWQYKNYLSKYELTFNVLQQPEGGYFELLFCQPGTSIDRSKKLDLTSEPPLLVGAVAFGFLFAIIAFFELSH
jgi:hypothetical protein